MGKPYEIVLSMRSGTARWLEEHLVELPMTRVGASDAVVDLARIVARGLKIGRTRAQLRLPYADDALRELHDRLRAQVKSPGTPYWVTRSLERLCADIDAARRRSVIDHLVDYTHRLARTGS